MQGSRALSCASSLETGMTITHSGFQNESLAFPPLLNKKKNPWRYFSLVQLQNGTAQSFTDKD